MDKLGRKTKGEPVGNERYWAEIEAEMMDKNIMQREAEINILYHPVKKMRTKDRMSYEAISAWLNETYGLSDGEVRTRRGWMRKAGLMLP